MHKEQQNNTPSHSSQFNSSQNYQGELQSFTIFAENRKPQNLTRQELLVQFDARRDQYRQKKQPRMYWEKYPKDEDQIQKLTSNNKDTNTKVGENYQNTYITQKDQITKNPWSINFLQDIDNEDWKRPRLAIQKIVLENFKSYGSRVQIAGIRSGFNGIVGPNGSGKSNIIDALLFVFGYNAKWMRQDKLANLVHSDADRGSAKKGYVQVHFYQGSKHGPTQRFIGHNPNTEIVLRRTVYSNSTSNYELNGKTASFKQVKDLLTGKGIDLNLHRFLILQGQVEQIAMMRPKGSKDNPGLLQFLQEVIGSGVFLQRIEEITKELEAIKQVQSTERLTLSLMHENLITHSSQKTDSVIFFYHVKKYLLLSDLNLQTYLHSNKRRSIMAAEGISLLHDQTKDIMEEQVSDTQIRPLMTPKQLNERFRFMSTKCKEINTELDRLQQKDKFYQQQMIVIIPDFQREITKLSDIGANEEFQLNKIAIARLLIPSRKEQILYLQNKIKFLQNRLNQQGGTQVIPAEYTINLKKINQLKVSCVRFAQQKLKYQNELSTYQKYHQEYAARIMQIEGRLTEVQENSKKLQMLTQIINEKIKDTQDKNPWSSNFQNEQKQEYNQLKTAIENKKLLKNNNLQRFNIAQKVKGAKIPGVIGRLGNLATCDPQYEIIISTSTPQLDNILVQTYQAAEKVVDFVKTNKLGRVICMIVDNLKQNQYAMKKEYRPVPDTVRLFDLVKPVDNNAKLAFYSAMRDSVFTKNSEKATDIAFNTGERKRVISIGKKNGIMVIDKSGVMSSFPFKKNGFGSNVSDDQIDNQIRELQKKINLLKDSIGVDGEKRKQYENAILTMRKQLSSAWNHQDQVRKQEQQLQKMHSKLLSQLKLNQNKIKQLRSKLEYQTNNCTQSQEEVRKLQQKTNVMRQNILKQIGPETFSINQLIERYNSKIKGLKVFISRTQSSIRIMTERQLDFNKKKQSHIKRINQIVRDFTKLKQDRKSGLEKGAQLFKKQLLHIRKFKLLYQASFTSFARIRIKNQIQNLKNLEKRVAIDQSKDQLQPLRQMIGLTKFLAKNAKNYKIIYNLLKIVREKWIQINNEYGFLQEVIKSKMFGQSIEAKDEAFTISTLQSAMPKFKKIRQGQEMVDFQSVKVDKKRSAEELDIIQSLIDKLQIEWLQQITALDKQLYREGSAIQFKNKYKQYQEKKSFVTELIKKKEKMIEELIQLNQDRITTFNQGFYLIRAYLKKVYAELSINGDVEISSINRVNPFDSGITVKARPPRKTWKQMNKLSGGEKTLTSLSLIFALQAYKPSPIYLMDEIDAALDVHNTEVIANFILRNSRKSQFIVISLRPDTFNLCDDLTGVIKFNNMTQAVILPPQYIVDSKVQNLHKVWLRNGTHICLYQMTKVDLRKLWDPSLCQIVLCTPYQRRVLKGIQRNRWIWKNVLQMEQRQTQFWLQTNGWHWKKKLVGWNDTQNSEIYLIKCEDVDIPIDNEEREIDMDIDELSLKESEKIRISQQSFL